MPDDVSFSSVPVAGGDLTVASWGPSDAPAVIALHGLTSTHTAWVPHAHRAGGRFRLIAPDLRGRGASAEIDGPWGFDAHVADVLAVLDAFAIDAAVIIGHSMGAYIALAFSAQHPDRVRGLVLVDGGLPEGAQNAGLYAGISQRALEGLEGRFLDAISADTAYIASPAPGDPLRSLSRPAFLLSATDGFAPGSRGTYWEDELAEWQALLPLLRTQRFADVHHGSIMEQDEPVTAALDAVGRLL